MNTLLIRIGVVFLLITAFQVGILLLNSHEQWAAPLVGTSLYTFSVSSVALGLALKFYRDDRKMYKQYNRYLLAIFIVKTKIPAAVRYMREKVYSGNGHIKFVKG